MIPIIGLILGIIIGIFVPYNIPSQYSNYVAVAILAAVDSVFGGIAASLQGKFNMKRYFTNPELKVSSVILLSIIVLFFTMNILTLKLHNDNLKESYIESIRAITARVVEKNPELKDEILPLVTKEISQEEAEKGKNFLAKYGLTRELENQLFPYINKASAKNNLSGLYIFALMATVLFLFNYFQYTLLYNKIRRLTLGAKKVIEGDYDISINENKEGDFSKLAYAFNSMRVTIRNNLSQLKKEKQFLVDLLSDISHQLKTPLSSMIVYNDIIGSEQYNNR